MTPEETKWRASVYAPEKLRRKLKLQYWLLGAGASWQEHGSYRYVRGRTHSAGRPPWHCSPVMPTYCSASSTTGGSWPGKAFRMVNGKRQKERKKRKSKKTKLCHPSYTHHCRRDPFVTRSPKNENYYAFLDINPLTKGHTLVYPKWKWTTFSTSTTRHWPA